MEIRDLRAEVGSPITSQPCSEDFTWRKERGQFFFPRAWEAQSREQEQDRQRAGKKGRTGKEGKHNFHC